MSRFLPVPQTLQGLLDTFGGRLLRGQPTTEILALATLRSAQANEISFLSSAAYLDQARATRAACLVTSETLAARLDGETALIVTDNPYGWYARFAQSLAAGAAASRSVPERHASATIAASAQLGARVRIGANAVIEAGAVLEDDVSVGPGCVVGAGARLGAGTLLHANVTVYHACEIGERGIVHSGAVIGADGFGFAPEGGAWIKIAQLGRVIIGADVEIGANSAVDRGALDDTRIGDGCKLDNLIQIAHNVELGAQCALAGCVGVAGSAVIGARCQFGGGAGVLGHLEICEDVTVSAMSLVTRSITEPGFYSGVFPLMRNADWERAAATTRHLPELRQRLRALERLTKDR